MADVNFGRAGLGTPLEPCAEFDALAGGYRAVDAHLGVAQYFGEKSANGTLIGNLGVRFDPVCLHHARLRTLHIDRKTRFLPEFPHDIPYGNRIATRHEPALIAKTFDTHILGY